MGGRGGASGVTRLGKSVFDGVSEKAIKKDSFFGKVVRTSNKYYKFDQVLSKDKIILVSADVVAVKGKPVYITGENTAIYLKDWQFRRIASREGNGIFAIKLDRNYFKEYTFKEPLKTSDGFNSFKKRETFDSLYKQAQKQQDWQNKSQWNSYRSDGMSLIYWNRIEKA